MRHLLFILLLMAVLITAGCVSENTSVVVTSNQTTQIPIGQTNVTNAVQTTTVTPTPTISQDPILGMWKAVIYDNKKNTFDIKISSDGRYSKTAMHTNGDEFIEKGDWKANPDKTNTYFFINRLGDCEEWIYVPSKDCIHLRDNYDYICRSIPQTPTSDPTPVPIEGEAQIISKSAGWDYLYTIAAPKCFRVNGIVRNNIGKFVTARVNVDVYDSSGSVKTDSGYDIVAIEPYGQSKFEITAWRTISVSGARYRAYISEVY